MHKASKIAICLAILFAISCWTNIFAATATTEKKAQPCSAKATQDKQATTPPTKPKVTILTADEVTTKDGKGIPSETITPTQQGSSIYTPIYGLSFYKPTYILPYYYTTNPYTEIYEGQTPDDQEIMPEEFKAQLSIKFSFFNGLLGQDSSINIAYSQLMYWQFYAESQYFRETNYQPEIFIGKKFFSHWLTRVGVEHQSNGQGGDLERSWNRAYLYLAFTSKHFLVAYKPWLIVFKKKFSDKHNPDIGHYMGYGELTFSTNFANVTLSLMLRNLAESYFKRGAEELTISVPLYKSFKLYAQGFSGYGQSLIEYDHYTNGIGVGFSLSDWI